MSTRSIEMVDCLSLLSTKVASNVFDLSSGMHHVSIRDQMVRAQIVIRDLCRGDSDFESLLIVGAGVAGICAALEAIQRGVKQVVVVDVREAPFSLLRDVHHRYVGPFMYEWPSTFSNNQSYPVHQTTPWSNADAQLQWISKDPVSADALANLLTQELKYKLTQINHGVLTICVNVSKSRIHRIIQLFAKTESARSLSRLQRQPPITAKTFYLMDALIWPSAPAGQKSMINITPNYVLLAAGMGVENRRLVMNDPNSDPYRGENYTGSSFWAKNLQEDLFDPKTANQHVAIFGGGDGALQDTLRTLTGCKHPLQFMSFLFHPFFL